MRYLVSLYGKEDDSVIPGSPEFEAELAAYMKFDEQAGDAVVDGAALESVATASVVRAGSGADAPLVTDGPFAETAEVMGGYYVLEAATLDAAIELARQIPAATLGPDGHNGGVEVRPLVQWWTYGEGSEGADDASARLSGGRYLALIKGEETPADMPNTPEWEQSSAEHGAFIEKHRTAVEAGAALQPVATATTVKVKDGQLTVTDGPFAETAEVIGGLYVLRTVSRDEANTVAAAIPINPGGCVELRPIMEMGD